MTKQQLKENLRRRIQNLSEMEIDENQSEFGKGYDEGFRQACLQILWMIKNYE